MAAVGGTRGNTKTLLTGVVDEVAFDLISRTINVAGRDKSAALHEQKTSDKWLNKKTTEIVKDLAERAGIKADVKTLETVAGKMLEQDHVKLSDGVSFATVMNKLAEIDNARWWVDADGVLRYVPFGSAIGSYSIFIDQSAQPIKSDCLHLRIHRDLQAAKRLKVRLRSWHTRKKQVHEYEATVPGTDDEQVFSDSIPGLQQNQVEKYARARRPSSPATRSRCAPPSSAIPRSPSAWACRSRAPSSLTRITTSTQCTTSSACVDTPCP